MSHTRWRKSHQATSSNRFDATDRKGRNRCEPRQHCREKRRSGIDLAQIEIRLSAAGNNLKFAYGSARRNQPRRGVTSKTEPSLPLLIDRQGLTTGSRHQGKAKARQASPPPAWPGHGHRDPRHSARVNGRPGSDLSTKRVLKHQAGVQAEPVPTDTSGAHAPRRAQTEQHGRQACRTTSYPA
jgi:hypothetical protein